ncbi:LYR motif-containing protein bcn92 isoform X2 [Lycorma delicatula]|uniref:LYR motif-containing protein bcn92 isoform X2 n=1 Tax=Lycorma delicatula TaxID=130591 RepID=UPI003F51A38E
MAITRSNVLKLYKDLLREASKFPIYNYRMYALRRIRDSFKTNSTLSESEMITKHYHEGLQMLQTIKRQVIVSTLYKPEKLIIE